MISYILSFIKCTIDFSLFFWMFTWFLEKRAYKAIISIVVIGASSIILVYVNSHEIAWFNTLAAISLSYFINLTLFDAQWFERMVSSVVAVLVGVMSEFFPIVALSALMDAEVSGIMERMISDAAFNLIGAGCFFAILRIGRGILAKKHNGRSKVYINSNGWSVLFPILSVLFVYYTLYTDSLAAYTDNSTIYHGIFYAIILIANIGFFFGETSAEKKNELLAQYNELKYLQDKTDSIMRIKDEHINEMNALMYDFDAQLNGLRHMVFDNTVLNSNIPQYIDEIKENMQETNRFLYIESKPLQLILNQTNEKCISYGINFSVDIRYASFEFMTFPDIFSLFENALDNAINACLCLESSVHPVIRLQIIKNPEQILLQISNTYQEERDHSKFYHTMRRTTEHGFGLQNIKKVVRKYNGTISVNERDEFRIMIAIPYNSIVANNKYAIKQ